VESARHYASEAGMSQRPEYYSGRGPNPGDLDSTQITKIHEMVLRDGGRKHADAFVAMVASLKTAAATSFLNGLYALEARDWAWPESARIETDVDLGPDVAGREAIGLATIAEAFGRSRRNDDNYDHMIRGQFLLEHGYTYDEKASRWRKLAAGETARRPRSYWGL
jgi:hypothetical protein